MKSLRRGWIIFIPVLLAAWLGVPSFTAAYEEWQPPRQCIFGMPLLGHVVKKGNAGLINEILKTVFEPEGYDFVHREMPYSHALAALGKGSIHCTLDVEGNRKGVEQGKATIAVYDMAVAYLVAEGFKGVKFMKDQKVAYLYGFNLQSQLSVKTLPQVAYDLSSAFHMLDRGHVHYVLDDETLLKDAIRESHLPLNEFGITRLKSLDIRLVFAPTDKGRLLRDMYDRRMKELLAKGKLQGIMRKDGMGEEGVQRVVRANGL